jgi:sirohydrochlorin ferrochelatase
MKGLIVFAHGSPVQEANAAVQAVAEKIRERSGYDLVEAAFLEPASPDLSDTVRKLVGSGVTRIVVVPYFLTPGLHITQDLPRIVDDLRRIHTGVRIEVTESLDGHPALIDAVLDRAREVDGGSGSESQAG